MAFLSDASILQSVADLLHQNAADLTPQLGTLAEPGNVITEGHAAAYNEIVGRLLNRGYTLAQITSWDQGVFYERQISLYFVLINVAGTFGYSDLWVKQYDRRKDLDTVLISVAGAFIQPVEGNPGTCILGTESTSGDATAWMNPATRRGSPFWGAGDDQ